MFFSTIRQVLLALFTLMLISSTAQADGPPTIDLDEVPLCILQAPRDLRVAVLTMSPGDEIFSMYGHTGLWVRGRGINEIYNFGVIRREQPNLLRGFLSGRLDYFLATRTERGMRMYYEERNRTVVAQWLDLEPDVAARLVEALQVEARPENRDYLYHWRDANCTTRLRDSIDEALLGTLAESISGETEFTTRDEILRHTSRWWYLWFGLHFGTGPDVDRELSEWDALFLPDRFFMALDGLTLPGAGSPLVDDTCIAVDGPLGFASEQPPRRGWLLWLLGGGFGGLLGLLLLAGRTRAIARVPAGFLTIVLGLAAGALGTGSMALWIDSDYAAFWQDFNLLSANPAAFLLLPVGVSLMFGIRKAAVPTRWVTRFLLGCSVLAAGLGVVVGVTGVVFQPTLGMAGLFLPAYAALALVGPTVLDPA